MNSLSGIIASS